MTAQIALFASKTAGSRLRIHVSNADSETQSKALPNTLMELGFVSIVDGPTVTAKAGGYGSVSIVETNRELTRVNVVVSAVQAGIMASNVQIVVQDYVPSLGDAILDGLAFGPTRRAARAGIDSARRAADAATNARDDFFGAIRSAGESVGDSLAIAGSLYVLAQIAIAALAIFAIMYLFKKGYVKQLLP